MSGLRRDDVPMDIAEEAVAKLQAMFPGFKIKFGGEQSSDEKVSSVLKEFADRVATSMTNGLCFECGAEHPRPWPPADEDDNGESDLADGWAVWDCHGGDLDGMCILNCPACDAKEPEEGRVDVRAFKPERTE